MWDEGGRTPSSGLGSQQVLRKGYPRSLSSSPNSLSPAATGINRSKPSKQKSFGSRLAPPGEPEEQTGKCRAGSKLPRRGVWVRGACACVLVHACKLISPHAAPPPPTVLAPSQSHIEGIESLGGWDCYCFKTNE